MLKLPQIHTNDEKANAIIAWYLNRNILGLVQSEVMGYESIMGKEAQEDDPDFWDAVSGFFPENYPAEKMGKAFLGLQALLQSEYEFVPELAMEYVMYSLINGRIEIADGLGIKTLEPIPFGRDYVVKVLQEEYPGVSEISGSEEGILTSWQEKMESLEDLHDYENIYFWDFDFLLLDSITEDELLASPVLERLGIGNIGDGSKKFVLPPEWMQG